MKIVGVRYSYNKNLQNESSFNNYTQTINTALKIRRMRNLTLEGKMTIFKPLAISNYTYILPQ